MLNRIHPKLAGRTCLEIPDGPMGEPRGDIKPEKLRLHQASHCWTAAARAEVAHLHGGSAGRPREANTEASKLEATFRPKDGGFSTWGLPGS